MGNFFRSKPNIIIPMTIILCRFESLYHQGERRGPHPHLLINPTFLRKVRIFDYMCYRLPFTNALQLERMLKRNELLLEGNAEFLSSIRSDIDNNRALVEFERGWKKFLAERLPPIAKTKIVYSSFADRNRSPSPEPIQTDDVESATGSAVGGEGCTSM
jgi:hypothetical protein